MLVEQVIGIEANAGLVRQLVLGHGIPNRIPRPVDVGRARADAITRLPSGAGHRTNVALRGNPCAKRQAVQWAGEAVGGGGLEQV